MAAVIKPNAKALTDSPQNVTSIGFVRMTHYHFLPCIELQWRIDVVQAFCCVPGCSNRSDKPSHLSFFRLPLNNKSVLKQWIHRIGRKNLPINPNTHVCSEHFERASNHLLQPDEVPSLRLPFVTANADKQRKPPKDHPFLNTASSGPSSESDPCVYDAATRTEECITDIKA